MNYPFIILLLFLFFINPVFGQINTQNNDEIRQLTYNVCGKLPEKPDAILFEKFKQAIAAQPDNVKLYLERAKCSQKVGDYASVLKDVSTILNLVPSFRSYHDSFLSELDDLTWTTDLDEAAKRADFLMTNNGNHFYSYLQSSSVKMRRNDFKGAFEDYLKSAELEPLISTYRFGILGDSLNKLREDKNNIEYFNRAFSLYEKILQDFIIKTQQNEGDVTTLFRMKAVNLQIGNILQAWSMILADLYLEKGQVEKSNACLEKMVQFPPVFLAYQARSIYYKRKGNFQKAEEDTIKSIETKIEDVTKEIELDKRPSPSVRANLYLSRGNYYLELKQFDKAIADFETAKSIDKNIAFKVDARIEFAKQKMVEDNSQPK